MGNNGTSNLLEPVAKVTTARELSDELFDLALSSSAPRCLRGMTLEVGSGPHAPTFARVVTLRDGQQYAVRVRKLPRVKR